MKDNSKTTADCQTLVFVVYVIWCRQTNMHYVGVTSKKPYMRIRQHKYDKRQFIDKEIQRIGWEGNFDWWIVEENVPLNLINEREQHWVAFFDSVYPNGYNKTHGGIGNFTLSNDTRTKIAIAVSGEKNHFYGKHHTDEAKAAMSAKLSGENGPNYGKHLSDETRAKIAIAVSGEKNPNYGKPSPFKGKKHTKETLAKMSAAHSREKKRFLRQTPYSGNKSSDA